MSEQKRFEDWQQVDCNECTHYWDSSCDGVSKGSKVGCNSYLATRSVVIPERLKAFEKRVSMLEGACILMLIANILTLVVLLIG